MTRGVVLLALFAGLATPHQQLDAQSATLGTVRGTVRDDSGDPLAGVRVVLRNVDGGGERAAVSERGGGFAFPLLAPGTWEARAERVGYRPAVVLAIPVRPGRDVQVPITLVAAPPPVTVVDTAVWSGSAGSATVAGWYPESVLRYQPLPGSGPLGAMTLAAGDGLGIGGLPSRYLGLNINSLPVVQAAHPGFGADPMPDLAWSRVALAAADYDGPVLDLGRSGAPVGVLSGFLRRGPRRFSVSADGAWRPAGAVSSGFFTPGGVDRSSWRGAVTIAGPIVRDTADFAVTIEAEDRTQPQAAAWSGAIGADTVAGAARDAWGTDLAAWRAPWAVRQQAVRTLGRFDWQVAERHLVSVTGAWGRLEVSDPDYGAGRLGWLGSRLEGTDWHGGVSVVSRLGSAANELRFVVSRAERTMTAPAGGYTTIVDAALGVGTSAGFGGSHARRSVRGSDVLRVPANRHAFTFGAGFSVDADDATWAWGTGGDRFYADATRFAAGEGVLVAVAADPPTVRQTHLGVAAWMEDAWQAAEGLELVLGARLDVVRRPAGVVTTNATWQDRTGLDNAEYGSAFARVSPRGVLRWSPAGAEGWGIELAGALRSSLDETDVFRELMAHDGRVAVRRAVGNLGTWPDASVGVAAPRLALLAPGFVPPRTGQVGMTVTGRLGGFVVRLSGNYRHLDFLPRRSNLNRLPAAGAVDQYGRPVYGTLVQQGGLLAADPLSARRFQEFELVSALNPDGAQDRWEGTVAIERRLGDAVGLLVTYTRSATRDNWLGALGGAPEDQLDPFPDGIGGVSWSEGVSDLDVPDRLVAMLDLRLIRGLRLGGIFQLQSGRPFTPGFRPGVDANADGSARNDPAWVDAALPGMDALLDAWPCLRPHAGAVAPRNACRMPVTTSLDLWARIELGAVTGLPVALTFQAVNVVEPDLALPDAALVLVDPNAAITANAAAGTVTVPLAANPNFGAPLVRRVAPRTLWIGLSVLR